MLSNLFALFVKWCKTVHGKDVIVTDKERDEIILKLLNGWDYRGIWEYYFQ